MIIKNKLQPTMTRTNSRFRGPTESDKYSNFVLEAVHDMKTLGSVMDRNEYIEGHRGHADFIQDNFVAYVGGGAEITSTISTAANLLTPIGDFISVDDTTGYVNLMDTSWVTRGGTTRNDLTKGHVQLVTSGLEDPAGLAIQGSVKEGDIIYIRMGVKYVSGSNDSFTLGSPDINQGEGDLKKFVLPQNGSIIYVDKRLYCKHREQITITIDVCNLPSTLQSTTVEVFDVQVKYMTENHLITLPVNTSIKSRVNTMDNKIKNIINNI